MSVCLRKYLVLVFALQISCTTKMNCLRFAEKKSSNAAKKKLKKKEKKIGVQLTETNKKYHKQCYIYYTSKQKIKRHLDKTSQSSLVEPKVKRTR